MAAKLDSIKPGGQAVVHCYGCNRSVRDEYLRGHLSVLGIEVASLDKKEKTKKKPDLKALSKEIEEGQTMVPVFGRYNTGMQNLGNSSYINSVV